jgi:hypothetical protein
MSSQARRTLRIDDPVAGDACHMARAGSPDSATGRLRDIALKDIRPNPAQPRQDFDDASLAALAESIRERGVLQPIIVQPRSAGGYELIAGERRWRASKIAGAATIPALVARPVDAARSIELALIENIAREDLGVIEEARTIAALLSEGGRAAVVGQAGVRFRLVVIEARSLVRGAPGPYPTARPPASAPVGARRHSRGDYTGRAGHASWSGRLERLRRAHGLRVNRRLRVSGQTAEPCPTRAAAAYRSPADAPEAR